MVLVAKNAGNATEDDLIARDVSTKAWLVKVYPTQFKLYDQPSAPKRPRTASRASACAAQESPQSLSRPTQKEPTPSPTSALVGFFDALSNTSPTHNTTPQQWNTSPSSSTTQSGLLDHILSQEQSQVLLTHCTQDLVIVPSNH